MSIDSAVQLLGYIDSHYRPNLPEQSIFRECKTQEDWSSCWASIFHKESPLPCTVDFSKKKLVVLCKSVGSDELVGFLKVETIDNIANLFVRTVSFNTNPWGKHSERRHAYLFFSVDSELDVAVKDTKADKRVKNFLDIVAQYSDCSDYYSLSMIKVDKIGVGKIKEDTDIESLSITEKQKATCRKYLERSKQVKELYRAVCDARVTLTKDICGPNLEITL